MLDDGVHGVSGLLSRDPEIFLQRPSDGGKDGLGSLIRVKGTGGT